MKKVININFQGRVIPIEDSAYDLLQQYIASLRTYFAKEEGRDEIINDIEIRICELFGEQLKKGSSCIMDEDVIAIMDSMGRPADFEAAEDKESEEVYTADTKTNTDAGTESESSRSYGGSYQKRRMYRNEEDKILGGVASGVANYLKIDPAVLRILFAISAFVGGAGLLIYVILWIALPSRSLITSIRKRLYRDPEDKVFGGVCGGLAQYFDINNIIPRIIFAAPFIFGLITTLGRSFFFEGPVIIGGFGGSAFIIAYIILWIVLPEAISASEKLEMRGEKVDLNSIRDTIMEDMQGFRGRADKIRADVQASATKVMGEAKEAWQQRARPFVNEAAGNIHRNGSGIGHAIGVIVKAFFMIIVGAIAFGLFIALIFLMSNGIGVLPLKDFVLNGFWQNALGWGALLLFFGTPILAILVWFIRKLMKVKKRNNYIAYTFSFLWTIGLVCLIVLVALVSSDFRSQVAMNTDFELAQPATGKLTVRLSANNTEQFDDWYNTDGVLSIENDSLYLNTVRVNVIRSKDSFYHLHVVKFSNGRNRATAQSRAQKISFPIEQQDSVIYLPESFTIDVNSKWRTQRVMVVIEVPIGKRIQLSRDLNDYDWFNMSYNRRRYARDWDRRWENSEDWSSDKDMLMTSEGFVEVGRERSRDDDENRDRYRYDENGNQEGDMKSENPNPPVTSPIDTTPQRDSTYRYPATRTAWLNEQAAPATSNVHFSPLASFLL
jgi:phage shock protein PspC (stress-responsive transcriptional regulator)